MQLDLNTTIVIGFVVTIASNTGGFLYLASRIDRVSDKLDGINEALGAHGEAIGTLKKQAEGPHILSAQR